MLLQQNAKVLEDHIFGFESFLLGDPAADFQITKLRSGDDSLLLKDQKFTELEKQILDLLLLGDSEVTDVTLAQTITALVIPDGLFLNDSRQSELEKQILDLLLLSDTRDSTLAKQILDLILLGDVSLPSKESTHLVTDDVLLREERFSGVERNILDLLLLGDSRENSLAKQLLDLVLLGDTSLIEKERTRLATDGVFLREDRFHDISKDFLDLLLLRDTRKSELQKHILDLLLLGDSSVTSTDAITLLLITDGLFLRDTRTSELTKKLLDLVLVSDSLNKELAKNLIDFLFLGDSVADLETILGILAVLVTDGIIFDEFEIKTRELLIENKLLIGDEATIETILDAITSIPPRILVELIQTLLDDS